MSKNPYLHFLKRLIILSSLLGIITLAAFYLLPSGYLPSATGYLFIFFIMTIGISHYILLLSTKKSINSFVVFFVTATVIKLLLYFSFLMFYTLNYPEETVKFIVIFFILYVFYTVFEIIYLLKNFPTLNSSKEE